MSPDNQQPLISVMMPCYNTSKYIDQAIESVLSQTHQDLELVIVDDCSTDDSVQKVRAYSDPRIKLHIGERNQGISRVRNDLFRYSSGKYVTSLDSDDFYCSRDKLSREYELIKKHGDKTVAFSNIVLVDGDGERLKRKPNVIREGDIFSLLLERSIMIPRDLLYSRELHEKAQGFDPELKIYEDWDFKLRLAKLATFSYSNIDGIAYRRHGSGLSAAPNLFHVKCKSRIRAKHTSFFKNLRFTASDYLTAFRRIASSWLR